jgi:transcriptional regulator with XRE-family HTH domain
MKTLADRVRTRRETLNISQAELARRIGAKAQVVQSLEGNPNQQTTKYLVALANALGTTAEWLAHGRGPETKQELLRGRVQEDDLHWVPEVTWREFADLARGLSMLQIYESDGRIFKPLHRPDIPPGGNGIVALPIGDDSMCPQSGIGFIPGNTIFVDIFSPVRPGDFVVAVQHGSDEPLFRQYRVLSDNPLCAQLIPLNENYPTVDFKESRGDVIAGRMIEYSQKY